jgi:spore germination cell wall hydrolase CwlJ-like protein
MAALFCATPSAAFQLTFEVLPATFSPTIAKVREQPPIVEEAQPRLTEALLQAYVARQQQLEAFDAFDVAPQTELTEDVLLSYIAKQRNAALEAIGIQTDQPALTAGLLDSYVQTGFEPTTKRVKHAKDETLCLAQALYHEARGESEAGQWAVANIIINRALSKRFPSTLCGVIFQNADKGRYHCQFTFACDGRSDMGSERKAWSRAVKMAQAAYQEFRVGKRPGVVPNSALYYHTTAVAPKWSHTFRRVAAIGAHVFYAPL